MPRRPQPRTKVTFDVPAGGCDCHVHVFGDPKQYPFFAGRTYTPETASVAELRQLLSALRLDRVVIVQPSVYGTDNSCTVDGLRQLGNRARGVAVIDDKTSDADLDALGKAGIRGIRLNLATSGITDPAAARQRFEAAVARVRNRNWHIQFNTQPSIIEALSPQLLASPVPLVIDHFGGATAARGVQQAGFGALVNLVKSGKAYVKISGGADRYRRRAISPMSRRLRERSSPPTRSAFCGAPTGRIPTRPLRPDRKPTDLAVHVQTDDGKVLNLLPVWVPDAATRQVILVDNPARLYGF